MNKIQYKKIDGLDMPTEIELNELGAEGWDMCGMHERSYIFKRPIANGMMPPDKVATAIDKSQRKHEPTHRK